MEKSDNDKVFDGNDFFHMEIYSEKNIIVKIVDDTTTKL